MAASDDDEEPLASMPEWYVSAKIKQIKPFSKQTKNVLIF